MSFLPDGFEPMKTSTDYFKIKQGENKIRILSSAIVGLEIWTHDNKPERHKMDSPFALSGGYDVSMYKSHPKQFWAFIVWNYNESQVQVASITQRTIQDALRSLVSDSDWGDPKAYDIKIKRAGEGMETVYTVQPVPAKPVDKKILDAFEEANIDLEQLFHGNDPKTKQKPVYNI